MVTEEIWW